MDSLSSSTSNGSSPAQNLFIIHMASKTLRKPLAAPVPVGQNGWRGGNGNRNGRWEWEVGGWEWEAGGMGMEGGRNGNGRREEWEWEAGGMGMGGMGGIRRGGKK